MSFSDSYYNTWRTSYYWTSDRNKPYQHEFQWYTTRDTYSFVSTVYYRIVCITTDTQSVNQHCYLKITANGATKVESTSERTVWQNWKTGEGMSNDVLLSGSFTVNHNYDTGAASFSIQLKSAIYYNAYQCDESTTISLPTISVTPPVITNAWDDGDNRFTVNMDWSEILEGTWGYCCIGYGFDPTMSYYSERVDGSIDSFINTTINLSDIVSITHNTSYDIHIRIYQWHNNAYKGSSVYRLSVTGYKAPNNPTSLEILTDHKNGKYTPKSNITLRWKADDNPKGFRLRVYKNGSMIYLNTNGYYQAEKSSFTKDSNGYYTYKLSPLSSKGFNQNDSLYFTVFSYNQDGKENVLWSGIGMYPAASGSVKIVPDIEYTAYAPVDPNNPNGYWRKVVEAYAPVDPNNPNGYWREVKQFHGKYGANNLFYSSKP